MRFVINGKTSEVQVTSVVIEPVKDNAGTEMFFCPKCRQPVFQYKGNIITIIPGMTKTPVPVIVICQECRKRYLINVVE